MTRSRSLAALLALLACVVALLTVVPALAAGECDTAEADAANEPGSAQEAPTVAPETVACTGSRAPAGDQDWYAITVASPGVGQEPTLVVAAAPATGSEVALKLLNPAGVDVTRAQCFNDAISECAVPLATSGAWKVGITGGSGPYALSSVLVRAGSTPRSCEPGGDASNNVDAPSRAPTLAGGALIVCNGDLDRSDQDWFYFDVGAATDRTVDASVVGMIVPLGQMRFSLLDPGKHERCQTNPVGAVPCAAPPFEGTWRGGVISTGAAGGSYAMIVGVLRVNPTSASASECEVNGDASGSETTPTALPMFEPKRTQASCRGTIMGSDAADWYRFEVYASTAGVDIVLGSQGGDQDLVVIDPAGVRVTAPAGAIDRYRAEIANGRKGTWKLGVLPRSGAAPQSYSINVNVTEQ